MGIRDRDEEERQIILLHAVSGLKHREIAELLEKPLSTVLSKYNRGLKKMKIQLEGEEQL
ncbi:MAG: helix-turn-helix domain-containing protein, partial [Oscillospiraceae bacterium]|nr:helix-turn-helix domain-containing protein [Oscillospiraceae bacterium]